MLQAIRKQTKSWLVGILFGLLILSFAIWGIGDIFRGGGRAIVVAEVGDVRISTVEFSRDFQRQIRQFGGRIDSELARQLGFVDQVLARMVRRTLFDLGAARAGIAIGDDLVRAIIFATPAFHDESGRFDRSLFEQFLFQTGLTEEAYVALLRRDLARGQLTGAVTAGGIAPDRLVDALYRYRREQRVADVVTVAPDSVGGIGEPDDATLGAFHRDNAEQFMAPEYRTLTVVSLKPDDLAEEIKVSEERLTELYEARLDEFDIPERREVVQILLADEDSARRAYDMLRQGRDLVAVAREITGQEPQQIGWLERGELAGQSPELAEAVFALPQGTVSEPIRSPFGWHVVRVEAIEPAHLQSLGEVRASLRAEIARSLAIDALYELANDLEDTLAGGATLAEAAAYLNLRPVHVPAVDKSGWTPEGEPAQDLPEVEELLAIAFGTAAGEESRLTETGDGGFFIMRVDSITPAMRRPLDSIRAEVLAAWRAARRDEVAEGRAEEIVQRVNAGTDLVRIAAEAGLEIRTAKPFTRAGTGDDIPPALIVKLFDLRPGQAAMAAGPDGYVVGRLKAVQPADPAADQAGVNSLGAELSEGMANDLVVQFGGALSDRFGVKIYPQAIEGLF